MRKIAIIISILLIGCAKETTEPQSSTPPPTVQPEEVCIVCIDELTANKPKFCSTDTVDAWLFMNSMNNVLYWDGKKTEHRYHCTKQN
jgi:hypothetical protein